MPRTRIPAKKAPAFTLPDVVFPGTHCWIDGLGALVIERDDGTCAAGALVSRCYVALKHADGHWLRADRAACPAHRKECSNG